MNRPTDDLDDVALPQRPRRPESRADVRERAREDLRDDMAQEEREFTLSTGTVLALFFGLALVCAVFFGFGYSMGHKSAAAAAVPVADTAGGDTPAATGSETAEAKPSAGSPAIQAIPGYQSSQKGADTAIRSTPVPLSKPSATAPAATSVTVPMDTAAPVAKPKKTAVPDPDGQVVGDTPRPAPTLPVLTPAASTAQTAVAAPAVAAGGTVYVQIAAVSHKEDADVLLGALRRRGYSVFTRSSDADKLIHVQVGPFASKKDAEVMRQKLLGDGYNAILK